MVSNLCDNCHHIILVIVSLKYYRNYIPFENDLFKENH